MTIQLDQFRNDLVDAVNLVLDEPGAAALRERGFVFRVGSNLRNAIEVQQHQGAPTIDTEYRAAGQDPKVGPFIGQNGRRLPIEVDLLLHERGGRNNFCAEFKKRARRGATPDPLDVLKIHYLLGLVTPHPPVPHPFGPHGPYTVGALLDVDAGQQVTVWWYLPDGRPTFHYGGGPATAAQRRDWILAQIPEADWPAHDHLDEWAGPADHPGDAPANWDRVTVVP